MSLCNEFSEFFRKSQAIILKADPSTTHKQIPTSRGYAKLGQSYMHVWTRTLHTLPLSSSDALWVHYSHLQCLPNTLVTLHPRHLAYLFQFVEAFCVFLYVCTDFAFCVLYSYVFC
jgi:hypothetical protein